MGRTSISKLQTLYKSWSELYSYILLHRGVLHCSQYMKKKHLMSACWYVWTECENIECAACHRLTWMIHSDCAGDSYTFHKPVKNNFTVNQVTRTMPPEDVIDWILFINLILLVQLVYSSQVYFILFLSLYSFLSFICALVCAQMAKKSIFSLENAVLVVQNVLSLNISSSAQSADSCIKCTASFHSTVLQHLCHECHWSTLSAVCSDLNPASDDAHRMMSRV